MGGNRATLMGLDLAPRRPALMITGYSPGTSDRSHDSQAATALGRVFGVSFRVLRSELAGPLAALIKNFEANEIGLN